MWEALAPIVRWPLYSPARFVVVVLTALVLVFLVGEVNDEDTTAHSDPTSTATASEPPAPFATPPASGASPRPRPPAANVGEEAKRADEPTTAQDGTGPSTAATDTAAAFVAAWARPDLDAEAWAAGVRPLVTPELWTDGLSSTDPGSTPEIAVRGEPRQVTSDDTEAVLDVPTTGPWIRVHLVADPDDGWLVTRVEPAS